MFSPSACGSSTQRREGVLPSICFVGASTYEYSWSIPMFFVVVEKSTVRGGCGRRVEL